MEDKKTAAEKGERIKYEREDLIKKFVEVEAP